MSGLLAGETVAAEVLGEVVKEAPNVETLINDVINFLHRHFPGAQGLPAKPAPTEGAS